MYKNHINVPIVVLLISVGLITILSLIIAVLFSSLWLILSQSIAVLFWVVTALIGLKLNWFR